jgi:NAD(P)-dependent dehydrogenase (short-subunit alcohol dehydrogenase family)
MKVDLGGRLALITGGGSGNGAAIAAGLAEAGARLVIADIDEDAAAATASAIRRGGGEAWSYSLDVSDAVACGALSERVVKEIGTLGILVNNAGILLRSRFDDPEAASHWRRTLAVNVDGPFNVTRAFIPALKSSRGVIVNVASIQSFVGAPTSAAYATSKGAVAQFTRTLALELAVHGIRVNAIAPGMIETAMSAVSRADPDRLAPFLRHVPLGRTAHPKELVGPVVFLASDAASYVTGAILPVDGGYLVV